MHESVGARKCMRAWLYACHFRTCIQPGAVKLVLWRHLTHEIQVHPVTPENQFHCTRLYMHAYACAHVCMHMKKNTVTFDLYKSLTFSNSRKLLMTNTLAKMSWTLNQCLILNTVVVQPQSSSSRTSSKNGMAWTLNDGEEEKTKTTKTILWVLAGPYVEV